MKMFYWFNKMNWKHYLISFFTLLLFSCTPENKTQPDLLTISEILNSNFEIELNDSLNDVYKKIKPEITDSNFNYLSFINQKNNIKVQHSFYFNSSLLFEKRAEIICDSTQNLDNIYQSLKTQAFSSFNTWEIDSSQTNQLLFQQNNIEILIKLNENNIQVSQINF